MRPEPARRVELPGGPQAATGTEVKEPGDRAVARAGEQVDEEHQGPDREQPVLVEHVAAEERDRGGALLHPADPRVDRPAGRGRG